MDILSSGIQWNSNIDINRTGKLDAIALWFDLHLDPDISIATDPTNKNCWEQAIFPILPSNFCHCGHDKGDFSSEMKSKVYTTKSFHNMISIIGVKFAYNTRSHCYEESEPLGPNCFLVKSLSFLEKFVFSFLILMTISTKSRNVIRH